MHRFFSLLRRSAPAELSAGVAATLGLVALAACWVPAHRATRVDPAKVLRAD